MRGLLINPGYTLAGLAAVRTLGQVGWTVGVGAPRSRGFSLASHYAQDWHAIPSTVANYGASKAYGEALGSYYNDYHGLSSIHVRIGFTISTDDPSFGGAALSLWLSHRDTAQVMYKAVDAPESLRYTVVFAMSDNYWGMFNLDRARNLLGYEPQDDAGPVINPNSKIDSRDETEYKQHYE